MCIAGSSLMKADVRTELGLSSSEMEEHTSNTGIALRLVVNDEAST